MCGEMVLTDLESTLKRLCIFIVYFQESWPEDTSFKTDSVYFDRAKFP